jgi:hypothetical protein
MQASGCPRSGAARQGEIVLHLIDGEPITAAASVLAYFDLFDAVKFLECVSCAVASLASLQWHCGPLAGALTYASARACW